jgi:hypothetical protein
MPEKDGCRMTSPCRIRMAETGKRLEFATSNGKFYAGAEALRGDGKRWICGAMTVPEELECLLRGGGFFL